MMIHRFLRPLQFAKVSFIILSAAFALHPVFSSLWLCLCPWSWLNDDSYISEASKICKGFLHDIIWGHCLAPCFFAFMVVPVLYVPPPVPPSFHLLLCAGEWARDASGPWCTNPSYILSNCRFGLLRSWRKRRGSANFWDIILVSCCDSSACEVFAHSVHCNQIRNQLNGFLCKFSYLLICKMNHIVSEFCFICCSPVYKH